MSLVTEVTRAKAEVYYGDERCREKFTLLLAQMGLPDSRLTVEDIEECRYVKDTGFVWLRHKKRREYYEFEDTVIYYNAVITAYFQPNKIKNLTGDKARVFLIWINLTEICVEEEDDSQSGFITFKTVVDLSRSFPLSLFGARTAVSRMKLIDQRTKTGAEQGIKDVKKDNYFLLLNFLCFFFLDPVNVKFFLKSKDIQLSIIC
ncbi:hypothetical protein SLA2020_395350 [Shorea laevis]